MNSSSNQMWFTNRWKYIFFPQYYEEKLNPLIISVPLIGHEELDYFTRYTTERRVIMMQYALVVKLHDLSQRDVALAITAISHNIHFISGLRQRALMRAATASYKHVPRKTLSRPMHADALLRARVWSGKSWKMSPICPTG